MANYKGLAVGAFGGSTIAQDAAGNDILTFTQITGATGDFIRFDDNSATELLAIRELGHIGFANLATTAPTTGLTKGDLFVVNGSTNMQIALCISTAANTLNYFQAVTTSFGRDTLATG